MTILDLLQDKDLHLLLISAFLGLLIGLEREINRKDPSLRTFTLISVGSCVFAMLSIRGVSGYPAADPTRIAAQIVAGIGFIGAGTIVRHRDGIRGLTTAALMWATAGIGAAVGFSEITLAAQATLVILVATFALNLLHSLIRFLRKEALPPRRHTPVSGEDE
ncbi:MAG: magnesium transporter MgtC [Proteobacteria bacterium]|nr:MAG: magnesium transporter MgtC [Pseudomonadota bacterium]